LFCTFDGSPRFYANSFAPEGAAIVSTVDSSRAALSRYPTVLSLWKRATART